MSRTRGSRKQSSKAGRRERHIQFTTELKERKKMRKKAAAAHRAYQQAAQMKKSRKKGTSDFDANMESLGYRRTYNNGGDILNKWREIA
jgi:hypothetical protein